MLEQGAHEKPRASFVYHALHLLNHLEHESNRVIPCCVNSEEPEAFAPELEGIAPVFRKESQHEDLFRWLRRAIADLPETALRNQFREVFDKIQGHFSEDEEEILVDILQTLGKSDAGDIASRLAMLRRMLELLIDLACIRHLQCQPVKYATGPGSHTRRILAALPVHILPNDLKAQANALYTVCSKYANHNERSRTGKPLAYRPGKYGFQRQVYTWMELLDYLL
jgi:hypothetical protein